MSRGTSIAKPIGCIHIKALSGRNDFNTAAVINTLGLHNLRMAITKSDGTSQLHVEIAYWNTATSEATLYFSTEETIAVNETKTYYLYYGLDAEDNSTFVGVTGSAAAQEVWGSSFSCGGFGGVWHFQQTPVLASATILDSTANANHFVAGDGIGTVSTVPSAGTSGPTGNYVSFDGSNDCLQSMDFARGAAGNTIESFFNLKSAPAVALASIFRHNILGASAAYTVMYGFETAASAILFKSRSAGFGGKTTDITCSTTAAVNTYFGACNDSSVNTIVHQASDDLSAFSAVASGFADCILGNVSGKMWVGGCYDTAHYASGYVPIDIYELRYSITTRTEAWMQWSAQSLLDNLNTFIGIEDNGLNSGNCTIDFTSAGYGGGAGAATITPTSQGEGGGGGAATIAFTSQAFGGWNGNGNATIVPTCDAESYNRGAAAITFTAPIVEADGYVWNSGVALCLMPVPTVQGLGGGQTKPGGLIVPIPTLQAAGIMGQVGHASMTIPMPTLQARGAGQTKAGGMIVPIPTLNAHGIMGLAGVGILTIPMPTCKATGAMTITGIGNCVVPMPVLRATGYTTGAAETTILRYAR